MAEFRFIDFATHLDRVPKHLAHLDLTAPVPLCSAGLVDCQPAGPDDFSVGADPFRPATIYHRHEHRDLLARQVRESVHRQDYQAMWDAIHEMERIAVESA